MAVLSYHLKKKIVKLGCNKFTVSVEDTLSASACEELKRKLVVADKEKYIIDRFENQTGRSFDEEDIWRSFDTNNGNFHIVPDEESRFKDGERELITA